MSVPMSDSLSFTSLSSASSSPGSSASSITEPEIRHVDLPPEIILEILSICAWEDQDIFRHVSPDWHSYISKSLRRTRFSYAKPQQIKDSQGDTIKPSISSRYSCGTHRLLKSLTLSYLWKGSIEEFRLDRRSDGVWWKEGEVTEDWLTQTFFWTESCTDPPMKDIKIRLKGMHWSNQDDESLLKMTCFARDMSVGVSIADICSRIKRLFAASSYRNVMVYELELKLDENGTAYLSGKANLTKKS